MSTTKLELERQVPPEQINASLEIRRLIKEHGVDELAVDIIAKKDQLHGVDDLSVELDKIKGQIALNDLTKETLVNVNAIVACAAEETLLGEGKETKVEQIKGSLELQAMNATQIACNQGKSSFILPTSLVARRILTDEQVHLMTINPQLKKRDGERLVRLADRLNLRVDFVDGQSSEDLEISQEIRQLYLADFSLDWSDLDEARKKALKFRIQKRLDRLQEEVKLRQLKKERESNFSCQPVFLDQELAVGEHQEKADIVVGNDQDFVFSFLDNNQESPWEKGKTSLFIDEELPLASSSPYLKESPSREDTQDFLRNWILANLTDNVCVHLESQQLVEQDEHGSWVFVEEDDLNGWDDWEFWLTRSLNYIDVAIPEDRRQVLEKTMLSNLQSVADKLDYGLDDLGIDVKALILDQGKSLPELAGGKESNLSFYEKWAQAWLNIKNIQEGRDYVKDPSGQGLILRNIETGHPLLGHRYQDATPYLLESREAYCSFENPSYYHKNRIGFHAFLQQAYGNYHVAVTSGTLEYLANKIEPLVAAEFKQIPRWQGLDPEITVPIKLKDRQAFLERFRQRLEQVNSEQNVLVVCDHDLELQWLRSQFSDKSVNIVDTNTSVEEEAEIYAQITKPEPGKAGTWVFANPRAGRGIDIQQPAHWLILGPLKNKVVLHQILERKRVGKEPVNWFIYQSDSHGYCGLEQTDAVSAGIEPDLDKIHDFNNRVDKEARAIQYFTDRVVELEREASLKQLRRIYRDFFTDRCLQKHFNELCSWDNYLQQIEDKVRSVLMVNPVPMNQDEFTKVLAAYNDLDTPALRSIARALPHELRRQGAVVITKKDPFLDKLSAVANRFKTLAERKRDWSDLTLFPDFSPKLEGDFLLSDDWIQKSAEGKLEEGRLVFVKVSDVRKRKAGERRLEEWEVLFLQLKKNNQGNLAIDDYYHLVFSDLPRGLLQKKQKKGLISILQAISELFDQDINWNKVIKKLPKPKNNL